MISIGIWHWDLEGAVATKNSIPRLLIRVFRWLFWTGFILGCAALALIALWSAAPPVSTLMAARYVTFRPVERLWTPLTRLSPHLVASVIASEDGQFCRHRGVDWGALREVIADADSDGPARGASTISMQTAKNLFLWPGRSALRKGLEIPFAMAIDRLWGKKRIIEVYLNIAEWGDGIFGAEAAARRYFRKSAAELTPREAALLVSALPNPFRRDPSMPGAIQNRVTGVIVRRAARAGPWGDCVK